MRKVLLATAAALATFTGAAAAQENYPNNPVTLVVPFSAGGASDTLARIVADALGQDLGQQIVIQNVAGAGGTLGAQQVANAAPDGYTLLLHHIGMSTAPALYGNLPFDPVEDFEHIGLVAEAPMAIVARGDFPPNTLPELVDYVKENKDTVTYAYAGIGSATQLCGMLFMQAIDTEVTMVPYQGAGPALNDLMGGQVDFICDLTTGTIGQIQSGDFKAYALTAPERLDSLPDLPTTAEEGFEDLQISVWYGLYAPAGTPDAVVERLSSALQTALQDENVVTRLTEIETRPVAQDQATPEALLERLQSQIDLWRPIIEEAGVTAD